MEFVHRPYQPGETIAALATPPGEGGIAIIRICGSEAIAVASRVFSGDVTRYKSHTAHFGHVVDGEGKRVDEALCLVMLGKRSYAGEDTIELQCHGGLIASRKVLETVLAAGARAALPGEFTFKAFTNGKIDLSQAEAVQHLIGAKSLIAFSQAGKHLEGGLSAHIAYFQQRATHLAAILEAWVDFPEEGIEFASLEAIRGELELLREQMHALKETFHDGSKIHHGIALCIVGRPNVGKSSLMNALLGKDRAIVTDIAGTTRDVLEEDLTFDGLHFRLIDTAGLRETTEVVEREGIRRSRQTMGEADLLLLLLDATQGVGQEERELLKQCSEKTTLVVWNKIDLPEAQIIAIPSAVSISAKKGEGLEELKRAISQRIFSGGAPPKDEVLITSARHKQALEGALEALERVISGLGSDLSPEFLSADMRQVLRELGTIIGTNISDDILTTIFSTFCIGK